MPFFALFRAVSGAANDPLNNNVLNDPPTNGGSRAGKFQAGAQDFMMRAFLRYCVDGIEFSPSFICDLVVSTAYLMVTTYLYVASAHSAPSTAQVIFIAVVVLVAQASKVALMFSLVRDRLSTANPLISQAKITPSWPSFRP